MTNENRHGEPVQPGKRLVFMGVKRKVQKELDVSLHPTPYTLHPTPSDRSLRSVRRA
ncbi:MAG: hypothetical protein F6J93_26060 [Oscillatoria sp. SIO1A7]|nr:hypothetical protein [Oscillatoria sp. SIO1A7]